MNVVDSIFSDSTSDVINDNITSDEYLFLSDSDETIHYHASLVITFATFTIMYYVLLSLILTQHIVIPAVMILTAFKNW